MNTPSVPSVRRGHRAWIPGIIWLLALGGLAALELQADMDRNVQVWGQSAVFVLALLLSLLWFIFLSRFSWRFRLLAAGGLALIGIGLKLSLRVDGTIDGRGLPKLVWKWSARPLAVKASANPVPPEPAAATVIPMPDVPQFFGPRRDGIVTGAGLARDWAKSPPRELWRQPVGSGWASYAVVAGRAYTQEQRGEEEWVSCYEVLTGRLIWAHRRPTRFTQWQAGEGPHSTPTIDRGRVFAYGATGVLDCLDAITGAKVWSRDVLGENQLKNLEWGISASPLVFENLVVVTGGQGDGPTVLAYDRVTGELRWRSGTDRASYSSPIVATLAGRPTIVAFNAATFSLHDPATGQEWLSQRWGSDKTPKAAQPVVLSGDRLFVSAGYGMGCELFHVTAGPNGQLAAESKWKNIRLKAQFNSVAQYDGFFYGLDDGFLACVEADTGVRRWKGGLYGSGQTLLVDDLILIQSERGDVALAAASPDAFRELGRITALSSKTWNHPTLAGRYLLVRNDREAVCYELPLAPPATAASGPARPRQF